MLKRISGFVMLIVLLPGICFAGGINVKRLDKQNWINIETANFNVLTNAKEKKAVEIVQELENFKFFLAGSIGYQQRDLEEKVPVVVAKNGKTFKALGMPNNIAGLFLSNPGYTILASGAMFRSSSEGGSSWGRSVVFHELVHLFMRNASLNFALPMWFDEGIAEYFGTYVEKKDKVIIGSLLLLESRFNSLRDVDGEFEYVDVEELLKTKRSDVNIGEESSKKEKEFLNKFYARATAVVHYMYSNPVRLNQMYHYLYLLKKEVPVDEAFSQAFDISYKELDVEIYQYLSKWALTGLAFRLGEGGVEFPEVEYHNNSIAKQDAMEILFEKLTMLSEGFLGDGEHKALFAGMEEFYPGLADRVMGKVLSEEPENLLLIMRTAMIYHNVERYDEVLELYEKALDIDASNPGILNNIAWFLATVPDMTLRDPQRAIPFAEKAVEINKVPQYMDTLAEAYYAAGSFQKAVEIINEAIALEPEYEYLKEQLEKFTGALEEV